MYRVDPNDVMHIYNIYAAAGWQTMQQTNMTLSRLSVQWPPEQKDNRPRSNRPPGQQTSMVGCTAGLLDWWSVGLLVCCPSALVV